MTYFAIVSTYDNSGVFEYEALIVPEGIDLTLSGREKLETSFSTVEDLLSSGLSTDKLRNFYNGVTSGPKVKKFTTKGDAARRLCATVVECAIRPSEAMLAPPAPVVAEAPKAKKARTAKAKAEKPVQPPKAPKTEGEKKERVRSRKPTPGETDVLKAYGVFGASNRATLLNFFKARINTSVPFKEVVSAIYGSEDKELYSMARKVLLGLFLIQGATELLFEVRKSKGKEGVYYGLFTKGNSES